MPLSFIAKVSILLCQNLSIQSCSLQLLIFTAVMLISALLLILADDGPFGFFVYLLFFLGFVLL